ncbi:MAG: glycosyltransferase family A protein [Smithellaceae bacterium]
MENPKVSVIIPVYNGEGFIKDAINSVLNQEYGHWECIVVDDGSSDESASIVKEYSQVIYLHQEHQCVAAARNYGVRKASGQYLAFLDADDIWSSEKLKFQVGFMEDHPEIDYSVTKHSIFLDDTLKELPGWVRIERQGTETTAFIPSALLVRKCIFDAVGDFDETYRIGDDSDWFLRAKDAGFRLGVIEKNLLYKRVHNQCLTRQTEICRKELLKSIKASLQRTKASHKISVVIPVYNGEKYLDEALHSVLNQSVKPFEILVVDDCSTDTTAEIARCYADRIRYIKREKNGGAAAARNDGIKSATGDYIAFLDADDCWEKNKIELQLREIKNTDAPDMIFGMISHFFSPETDDSFRRKYHCPEEPVKGLHAGTMLIKREKFLSVGYFDSAFSTGEFIDWYQRALDAGMKTAILPDVLMCRRIHPLNHGIVNKNQNDDYARIAKEAIIHRRKKKNDSPI